VSRIREFFRTWRARQDSNLPFDLHCSHRADDPRPGKPSQGMGVKCGLLQSDRATVRTQRTPEATRRLPVEDVCTSPVSKNPRFLVQEAASRFCLRKCLRISTDNHAPHLIDREPLRSLPRSWSASYVRDERCISFRRHTPHRRRI
jgi:hypothetical protein